MLIADHLTRHYGDFTAVDDVSFTVKQGEIVGLLGHNGAGKTTIMKMLTGYLEPSGGSVSIEGFDVETQRSEAQQRIGYLPENCPLYLEMTVVEFLDYAAGLRGVAPEDRPKALQDAIAATELGEKASDPISSLSRGYRQRVGVAQAILHKPQIVILDEPTNGLDPSQIRQMRDLIKQLATRATVMLSTHILQEVQAVCDRVIVINRGKLVIDSALADLHRGGLRLVTSGAPEIVEPLIAGLVERIDRLPGEGPLHSYGLHLASHALEKVAPEVARAVIGKGLDLIALHPEQHDLEAVFAEITARDGAQPEVR